MSVTHRYELTMEWTGNTGTGTSHYRGYSRDHVLGAPGKMVIAGSSDPAFRGDRGRWNPEELLVASLAQCHMLAYLHLCASAGVTVTAYTDAPTGTLTMDQTGDGGEVTEVTLRPSVQVTEQAMVDRALALHDDVPAVCFIARSVSFPVKHEPTVTVTVAGA
ncbi:MAG TPA: OsmC family protein [Streptosporangiaceae bacterium]